MLSWRQRWHAPDLILLVGAACALLCNLGRATLLLWDESLYCGTTADMQRAGTWIYPTLDGEFFPWYGKGVLINWLQQGATQGLGWSIAALRLPTALGMLLTFVLVSWQARKLAGRQVAWCTLALMMCSAEMLQLGRHIMLENLILPCNCIAFIAYTMVWRETEPGTETEAPLRPWRAMAWCLIAALAMATTLLTKQAFGLFAPTALLVAEGVFWRRKAVLRLLFVGSGVLVGAGWWFVLAYRRVGAPFMDSLWGYHLTQRFTTTLEGHSRGLNAYAISVDQYLGVMPWVLGLVGWVMLLGTLRQTWQRFLWTRGVRCSARILRGGRRH